MKNIYLILLMTLISIGLWIGLSRTFITPDESEKITLDTLPPIDGTIDLDFLKNLSNN